MSSLLTDVLDESLGDGTILNNDPIVIDELSVIVNNQPIPATHRSRIRKSLIQQLPLDEVKVKTKDAKTWTELAKNLGYPREAGTNNRTIRAYLIRNKIDFSHLPTGRSWMNTRMGKDFMSAKLSRPLEQILVTNSTVYNSSGIKKKLIKAGMIEDKCQECGIGPVYNGRPLTLDLDHINGNHKDNRLENLRVLCPNCHRQTPTFGAKNKAYQAPIILTKIDKYKKKCSDCPNLIFRTSMRCGDCHLKNRRATQSRAIAMIHDSIKPIVPLQKPKIMLKITQKVS